MSDVSLYIFGDSYAATQDNQFHHYFEYSWPRKLEKTFDVKNYAVGGSGPQDVCIDLHNLIVESDKDALKNAIAIIILPDISRYNFSFFKKRNHSVFGQLNDSFQSTHYFVETFLNVYDDDKLKFLKDFNRYYLEHPTNWILEEVKYLSYFDNVAKNFKQTLVWPVNPTLSNYSYQHIDIAPVALDLISAHEQHGNTDFGSDTRLNHVSIANHNVILEQLYSWIFNKTPIEDRFLKE